MRPIAKVLLILAVCLGAPRIECGCAGTVAPLRVILDADLDSDVDDVGALAMLMNLHNRGLIELIGVIITSDDPFAPGCARVLLDHFGTKEIPIGFLKNQSRLTQHSRYTRKLVEEFSVTPMAWQSAEDAAPLYRKLLADSPDASVALITIGHLSSLQALLQSAPDAYSQLTGIDLAHQKIRRWICMGGQYPSGKEANFYRPDPASTLYCLEHWRGSALFCGWEAGNPILTGGSRLKELLPSRHPVYRAYQLYNDFHGRQSWDQLAVLQLLPIAEELFSRTRGRCVVAPDGSNHWQDDPAGNHQYIALPPDPAEYSRIAEMIDHLMAGEMPCGPRFHP